MHTPTCLQSIVTSVVVPSTREGKFKERKLKESMAACLCHLHEIYIACYPPHEVLLCTIAHVAGHFWALLYIEIPLLRTSVSLIMLAISLIMAIIINNKQIYYLPLFTRHAHLLANMLLLTAPVLTLALDFLVSSIPPPRSLDTYTCTCKYGILLTMCRLLGSIS